MEANLCYPFMKNCSFVTESKNFDPLITMLFNAKAELVAHASKKIVAEILIMTDYSMNMDCKRRKKRK